MNGRAVPVPCPGHPTGYSTAVVRVALWRTFICCLRQACVHYTAVEKRANEFKHSLIFNFATYTSHQQVVVDFIEERLLINVTQAHPAGRTK